MEVEDGREEKEADIYLFCRFFVGEGNQRTQNG